MSEPELTVPSAADQQRLEAEWLAICKKIDASPSIFRLEFGRRFDSGFCIFRCADGWMVLDIMRGSEEARQFYPTDDDLLYERAKGATSAMAGWARAKEESSFSKMFGALFHYIDPRLDTRLQLRQQRWQAQRRQMRLMEKVSADWARRLASDHQSEIRSSR